MRLGQCHSFSSQEFLRHEYYYKKMCVKKLFGVVKVTHAIEASGHMFYLMRFLASKYIPLNAPTVTKHNFLESPP